MPITCISVPFDKNFDRGDAYSCSKCEFQIIRTECLVVDGNVEHFVEETWVTEKVLCDTEPETEELCKSAWYVFPCHY
jgi:hypothetical protein